MTMPASNYPYPMDPDARAEAEELRSEFERALCGQHGEFCGQADCLTCGPCATCDGTGSVGEIDCPVCGGSGDKRAAA